MSIRQNCEIFIKAYKEKDLSLLNSCVSVIVFNLCVMQCNINRIPAVKFSSRVEGVIKGWYEYDKQKITLLYRDFAHPANLMLMCLFHEFTHHYDAVTLRLGNPLEQTNDTCHDEEFWRMKFKLIYKNINDYWTVKDSERFCILRNIPLQFIMGSEYYSPKPLPDYVYNHAELIKCVASA